MLAGNKFQIFGADIRIDCLFVVSFKLFLLCQVES